MKRFFLSIIIILSLTIPYTIPAHAGKYIYPSIEAAYDVGTDETYITDSKMDDMPDKISYETLPSNHSNYPTQSVQEVDEKGVHIEYFVEIANTVRSKGLRRVIRIIYNGICDLILKIYDRIVSVEDPIPTPEPVIEPSRSVGRIDRIHGITPAEE